MNISMQHRAIHRGLYAAACKWFDNLDEYKLSHPRLHTFRSYDSGICSLYVIVDVSANPHSTPVAAWYGPVDGEESWVQHRLCVCHVFGMYYTAISNLGVTKLGTERIIQFTLTGTYKGIHASSSVP